MKKILFYTIISILCLAHFACVKSVQPNLPPAENRLVVEAFLSNNLSQQDIKLSQTQPYFDTTPAPSVTGAQVSVADGQGNTYTFQESQDEDENIVYRWESPGGETIVGSVGEIYTLTIAWEGETYQATSRMRRVPEITQVIERDEDDKLITEFFANDFPGTGDIYRAQLVTTTTYDGPDPIRRQEDPDRNVFILQSSVATDSNFIYDAAFGQGTSSLNLDGVEFLPSVRIVTVSRSNSDNTPDPGPTPGDGISLYIVTKSVEMYAYTPETALFEEGLRDQERRASDGNANTAGGQGILSAFFSSPPFNVYSNIKNTNPEGKGAVGIFNVANVSSKVYSTRRR